MGLTRRCIDKLVTEHDFDLKRTLMATSVCSDEVIRSATNFRTYLGIENPFQLGGLAGFPFAGLTGLKAFLGHVPDRGSALILYGPHIGVSKHGEIGIMQRDGQMMESSCCGALQASLSTLLKRGVSADRDLDFQLWNIESELAPHQEEILAHHTPLVAVTDIMFDVIRQRIQRLIEASGDLIKGKKIAMIGGVIVNTDYNLPDWFDLRHFQVIDRQTSLADSREGDNQSEKN